MSGARLGERSKLEQRGVSDIFGNVEFWSGVDEEEASICLPEAYCDAIRPAVGCTVLTTEGSASAVAVNIRVQKVSRGGQAAAGCR